jgi:hypothetical protein
VSVQQRISGSGELAAAVHRWFGDARPEGLVVVGFGAKGEICGVALNSQHRALSWIKVWELATLAAELEAGALVVMVFPGGPALAPSTYEVGVFSDLLARTRRAGVVLLDCYVHRGGRMWSLREMHDERVGS